MMLRSPRSILLAVALATLTLALPAAAHADRVVLAASDAVHGYGLTVLGDTGQDILSVMLTRDDGPVTQEHLYTFRGLRIADHRIRGRLGRLGSIDLRFRKGADADLPPGCHGRVIEEGAWRGRLRLNADDDFFGTIRERRMLGQVLAGRTAECDEPGEADDAVGRLTLQAATERVSVIAEGRDLHFLVSERRGGAHVNHLASAPSRLVAADDLSSATVASAGSRLVTGALAFSGSRREATADDGPRGDTAVGTVTGNLTAHFDSIGDVMLPQNAEALLARID